MRSQETSKLFSLHKSTYINLRWIAYAGQLTAILIVQFFLEYKFNYFFCLSIIFVSVLTNLYLQFKIRENQLINLVSTGYLAFDIVQLGFLFYLTGGITNPFIILIIFPSIISGQHLNIWSSIILVTLTILILTILTFYHYDIPHPEKLHFYAPSFYLYSIPLSILGTPLSTILLITKELQKEFGDNEKIKKDLDLLISQSNRCNEILKKLSLNPIIEDEFIDSNASLYDYIYEIVRSFQEISKKKFVINLKQFKNRINIYKSTEIIYGLRNFIGNANKFGNEKIEIFLKSNNKNTEVIIRDDGPGFPKDLIDKHRLGEPYIRTVDEAHISKHGLGLGTFIGKTLLEKNFANIIFKNSNITNGAEIIIQWDNKDLINV